MLVLVVYSAYFAPKAPKRTAEEVGVPQVTPAGGQPAVADGKSLAPAPTASAAKREPGQSAVRKEGQSEGKDIVVETDLYRLVLTTSGARLKSCRLKAYQEAKVNKELLARDLSRTETALRKATREGVKRRLRRERDRLQYLLDKEPLHGEGVELVPFDGAVYGNYPLTLISPALDTGGDWNSALYQPSRESLTLDGRQETGTIEFRYLTADGIEVSKLFRFSRDSYLITLEVRVRNNTSRAIAEGNFLVAYGPGVGLVKKTLQRGRKSIPFASWIDGGLVRDFAGKEIGKGFVKKTTLKWDEPRLRKGLVGWTAMRSPYFAVALIPEKEEAVAGVRLLEREDGTRQVALAMSPFSLREGEAFRKTLSLYLGPQDIDVLRQSGSHLEMLVDFGFWSWIARPIYALLKIFYKWFGNYGLSIIVLSLTIKLVFYPFTHKSFEAMKNMQEGMKSVQPEIDALKEKYKDNPQKLNKATMELYKKRGVNPLGGCKGGCLPLLFQTPVFFALYAVLYNAIELRQAPFFFWVTDLSSPDPYKVLPILMGGTMYLQQKLTGMGGSGGAQPDQAKMMSIMMPVVLTFVFLNLPSGIVLYWLCFNVFTSLQQLLIKRKSEAKAKA